MKEETKEREEELEIWLNLLIEMIRGVERGRKMEVAE